ncbi:4a-hydroxytetrahydrobiopterin dehydratase [Halomarina ordinaria]|uniref:4a-hydroxytetrahydrobiopterin dehydratase n=1 Tax=Halomarina ordinaria TaxID=3033939 RepID=A0ABD5U8B7_9EURY|nr:4a-hydroxytetrahydrobiopterin dehydratase [Halomarina sp. PSRA2]
MADLLSDEEIAERAPDDWDHEGDELVRTYEFDAYLAGVGFAAGIAGIAEEAYHHPEIVIGWREVEVHLTSHEEGGITEKDVDLAARFDDVA